MNIFDRLRAGVKSGSVGETRALALDLAHALPPDSTIALHGDLGAGKTAFVSGMAPAWGISQPVTSPTYNLFTLYRGTTLLAHLDAYRLRGPGDMDALMLEEFLASPWCLAVEWPENIGGWLPEGTLHIHMEDAGAGARRITLA
jgi:tRNA threonylcarbamoyladenosine biosynthesis protein TsaE